MSKAVCLFSLTLTILFTGMLTGTGCREQNTALDSQQKTSAAAEPTEKPAAPVPPAVSKAPEVQPATPTNPANPVAPRVELATSKGKIIIELNPQAAPLSTENFLRYVRDGFYDGTIFHRVIPGFMIQGGGFTPDMVQKQTQGPIKNEAGNGLKNLRGTLSMARRNDPDSATSQFFINVRDNAPLDRTPGNAGYAVFAKVVEGMEVADAIVAVPTTTRGPHENVPLTSVIIEKARVLP